MSLAMSIHDILTPDVLDCVPPGDEPAFTYIAKVAHAWLMEQLRDSSDDDWNVREETQFLYVNTVLNAAKRYNIQPLCNYSVPKRSKFATEQYRDIKNDIDGYLTQLILSGVEARREFSVEMAEPSKTRIRTLVAKVRECLDRLDIKDTRRDALHAHLDRFEAELNRRRADYAVIAAIATHILAGVAGGACDAAVSKLMSDMLQIVGVEKQDEVERAAALPAAEPMRQLVHIRSAEGEAARERFTADLDDEIPF
jgi:hypothetical protein